MLYYSVGILGSTLPALAGSIGILITIINIIMTFPPIYLIDEHRVGRKNLMVGSAIVMTIASALLGAGIIFGYKIISAVCMILMVAGFSFGLGPIPFVILPELVPSRVRIPPKPRLHSPIRNAFHSEAKKKRILTHICMYNPSYLYLHRPSPQQRP